MQEKLHNSQSNKSVTGLSTSILRHVNYWLSLGYPKSQLQAVYGEHFDSLNDWRHRVPVEITGQALEDVAEYFNDHSIAFKTGMDISFSSIQVFGHLLLTCPTMRDFIVMAIQFQHIGTQGYQALLNEGELISSYDLIVPNYSEFNHHQIELNIGAILKLVGEVLDYSGYNMEVHFRHHNTDLEQEAKKLSKAKFLFGQEQDRIVFDSELLDKEINFQDPIVFESSKTAIRKRLKELKTEALFPDLCLSIVEQYLDKGSSNLDFLAELLQLSRRTLQMRLTAQNTNFRKILDSARKNKLKSLLGKRPPATLTRLIAELGFSSETAFHEAYERWYGRSFTR